MLAKLWDNERLRNTTIQAVLLMAVVIALAWIVGNTSSNLAERGIKTGPGYLSRSSNFPISESILPYDPSDSFAWAYFVGLGNTLFVSTLAIIFSTLFGLVLGIARRSNHVLLSGLSGGFTTVIRNMPLIVQLLFWYAIATTVLPAPRDAWNPMPGMFLTLRGIYIPGLDMGPYGAVFTILAFLLLGGALLAVPLLRRRTGRPLPQVLLIAFAVVAASLAVLWIVLDLQAVPTVPQLRGLNFTGGFRLSAEFSALMVGLVIYTSVFIGEIIRGGIDAVSRGQWEAARALGINERQALFKIILPQALRVIIPPLTSQYLSTVKNTTLAVAVGFPELGLIVNTVIIQSGQAIESILVLLAVFLTISLSVSAFMNWYNARVALVVR